MTSRFASILELQRQVFAAIDTLDPAEADIAYRAVLDHVRARRPESVGCLGQLPEPGERIADPRGDRR